MKICVEIGGLNDGQTSSIASEIQKNWGRRAAVISPGEELPADTEGLLVVGKGRRARPVERLLMVESLDPRQTDLEQILFQVNATLGRMIGSDLVKTKVSVTLDAEKDKISRRDLFLRLKGGNQTYSDAPFVFASACEAKYGCTKCVDACPADALRIGGGSVLVDEVKCTRCGECAPSCPVSAIQLPRFSEDAFLGLIDGLKKSKASRKALVLTCDRSKVDPLPWTCVEQVQDVGIVGLRQIALAAGSGLSGVFVYCADGSCEGMGKARQAAESVRSTLKQDCRVVIEFLEGRLGAERIKEIHARLEDRSAPELDSRGESWTSYVASLRLLSKPEAPAGALGFTNLSIDNTCTLCGSCVKSCPHTALGIGEGRLDLDSSKCTGCGYCAEVCPEDSITLQPLNRVSDLTQRTIFRDVMVNCARCGKPLDSARLLKRVTALVGKEDPMMKYCPSCKQIIALESLSKRGPA